MVFNTSTKRAAPPSDSSPAKKQRVKSADTDSDDMLSRSETPGQQADFHGPFITLRVKDTDEHGNLREYDFKVTTSLLRNIDFSLLNKVTLEFAAEEPSALNEVIFLENWSRAEASLFYARLMREPDSKSDLFRMHKLAEIANLASIDPLKDEIRTFTCRHFFKQDPESVSYKQREWAAINGFEELREFAQEAYKEEIYEQLAKKDTLAELVERGMPLKVLDGLMCEAAAVMMEAKFSKTKVKCKSEES